MSRKAVSAVKIPQALQHQEEPGRASDVPLSARKPLSPIRDDAEPSQRSGTGPNPATQTLPTNYGAYSTRKKNTGVYRPKHPDQPPQRLASTFIVSHKPLNQHPLPVRSSVLASTQHILWSQRRNRDNGKETGSQQKRNGSKDTGGMRRAVPKGSRVGSRKNTDRPGTLDKVAAEAKISNRPSVVQHMHEQSGISCMTQGQRSSGAPRATVVQALRRVAPASGSPSIEALGQIHQNYLQQQWIEGRRAADDNPEEGSGGGRAAALHKSNITKDMVSLSSLQIAPVVKRDLNPSFISELSEGKSMTLSPDKGRSAGKKAIRRTEQQRPDERQPRQISTSRLTRLHKESGGQCTAQENRKDRLTDRAESVEARPMGTEGRARAHPGAGHTHRAEVVKRPRPQEAQDLAAQHIFQRLSQKVLDDGDDDDDEFGREPTHEDRYTPPAESIDEDGILARAMTSQGKQFLPLNTARVAPVVGLVSWRKANTAILMGKLPEQGIVTPIIEPGAPERNHLKPTASSQQKKKAAPSQQRTAVPPLSSRGLRVLQQNPSPFATQRSVQRESQLARSYSKLDWTLEGQKRARGNQHRQLSQSLIGIDGARAYLIEQRRKAIDKLSSAKVTDKPLEARSEHADTKMVQTLNKELIQLKDRVIKELNNNNQNQQSNKNSKQQLQKTQSKIQMYAQQQQTWGSKNSSPKRAQITEQSTIFQKARVSTQSQQNNSALNIKTASSAIRKAQFSLERKNPSYFNQQNSRGTALSQLDQIQHTFSNRQSDAKKYQGTGNTLSNRIEELTQGISNPHLKGGQGTAQDPGTLLASQSSRDPKNSAQNLSKFVESKERKKRAEVASKPVGAPSSGSRLGGVRYYNDISSKTPNKQKKLSNNRRGGYYGGPPSQTNKKALNQSLTSLNSGKGVNQSITAQDGTIRKEVRGGKEDHHGDLQDQPLTIHDMKYEGMGESSAGLYAVDTTPSAMSPLKSKASRGAHGVGVAVVVPASGSAEQEHHLQPFNINNMAQSPIGGGLRQGGGATNKKMSTHITAAAQGQRHPAQKMAQPVKSERSEQRTLSHQHQLAGILHQTSTNHYLRKPSNNKDRGDEGHGASYGHRGGPSRLFNSKSPSKKSIQLQQILKSINLLSSSRLSMNKKRQTTTSTVLDFKNSTSKSSSLIRNFINQVNSGSQHAHAHTKSIQAIKTGAATSSILHSTATRGKGAGEVKNSGSVKNQSSALGHQSQGGLNIATLESTNAPSRGLSNRNRHVNPYIQSKNRMGSIMGNVGMGAGIPEPSGMSRNQASAATSTLMRNQDGGSDLIALHGASPSAGRPAQEKPSATLSSGLHDRFLDGEQRLLRKKSSIRQSETGKREGALSSSLDKKKPLTTHTLSSSLKQKIEYRAQVQAAQQKAGGRVNVGNNTSGQSKVLRFADSLAKSPSHAQTTAPINDRIHDRGDRISQERPMQSLVTDRSDRVQTHRRKKTERMQADKGDAKAGSFAESQSFIQRGKPKEPHSGTAKKAKNAAATRGVQHLSNSKQVKIGRPNHHEMASKQAINSPLKGTAPPLLTSSGSKYNNQYVAEYNRPLLGQGNAQATGLKMKQSEIAAPGGRLDTSAAVFDSNELNEEFEREGSAARLFEYPTENIDEIAMPISHIKTPKKVSDMRSKPERQLGASGKSKKKGGIQHHVHQTETKEHNQQQSTVHAKYLNSVKKETKYMAISLSNENLHEPAGQVAQLLDLAAGSQSQPRDRHSLSLKYQTQISQDRRNEMREILYENPYRDSLHQGDHHEEDEDEVDVESDPRQVHIEEKSRSHKLLNAMGKQEAMQDNFTEGREEDLEDYREDEDEDDRGPPAEIFLLDGQRKNRDHSSHLPEFAHEPYQVSKSRSQQVPESSSAASQESTQPLDATSFLELFKDQMLEEEIAELGAGKNQFDVVYFAGSIPSRTSGDLARLRRMKSERVKAFKEKKEEAKSECNNGEFQGNPVFDNFEGYYKVEIGEHIAYRYEIMKVLGKGSFAQVVQCRDHKYADKEISAVKITRNTEMDHKFAHKEAQYLRYIMQEDPQDKHNIVRMVDQSYFRDHHCFVFELLHTDLFEHLKATGFVGFSTDKIRDYALQILKGLVFLEKHKIIHCDLKPENILCADAVCRNLKIVDFGSGCFRDEQIYTYVQSRFYRSPEVILRIKYTEKVDIWSLGCILAELYTGEPLFPGNNEQEQLELIMELSGMPPESMIDKSRKKGHYFDTDYSPFLIEDEELGILRIPNSRTLKEAVPCEDTQFLDFIMKCLEIDPVRRFSASEAMEHPWIKAALQESIRRSKLEPAQLQDPRLNNEKQKTLKRMGQNESDEQLYQPQILREREFREREGQEIPAECSPERDIAVQRKSQKPNKESFGIKLNNFNDHGAGGQKSQKRQGNQAKKKQAGTEAREVRVVDFIAEQKAGGGHGQPFQAADYYFSSKSYDTDAQRDGSNLTSIKDSESRGERSSQMSLVTDKEQHASVLVASHSRLPGKGGLHGLSNSQVVTGAPAKNSSNQKQKTNGSSANSNGSGANLQPRKSILPQIDYTNKYVRRQQQSRVDPGDKDASSRNANAVFSANALSASQTSLHDHSSAVQKEAQHQQPATNQMHQGPQYEFISKQVASRTSNQLSQMEQISAFAPEEGEGRRSNPEGSDEAASNQKTALSLSYRHSMGDPIQLSEQQIHVGDSRQSYQQQNQSALRKKRSLQNNYFVPNQ